MIKKSLIILILLIGIVSNAFSVTPIYFNIPDSPVEYSSNTWDENNWTEINVRNVGPIMEWSINYTWTADDYPEDASFYVLSPSGTQHTIGSAEVSSTSTVTSNIFNGEPANGTWRLCIEDSYGDGGCGAANISMSIVDDQLLNLSSEIQLMASASDYYTGSVSLTIDDNESAILTILLPDRVINGDTVQAKICVDRNVDLDTNPNPWRTFCPKQKNHLNK